MAHPRQPRRRPRRRLRFSIAAVVLLLAATTLALVAVVSYWRSFMIGLTTHEDPATVPATSPPLWARPLKTTWHGLFINNGNIMAARANSRMVWESPGPEFGASVFPAPLPITTGPLGFSLQRPTAPGFDWTISAPAWVIALPLAASAFFLHRRHRNLLRRNQENLCPTCGYDLRASPERCPECGSERSGQASPLTE